MLFHLSLEISTDSNQNFALNGKCTGYSEKSGVKSQCSTEGIGSSYREALKLKGFEKSGFHSKLIRNELRSTLKTESEIKFHVKLILILKLNITIITVQ